MASSSAVTASHSYFSAFSPGNAKRVVLEHLAESPRLVPVTAASHLEIRPAPVTVSFGIPELDTLTGGLPRGGLTEIAGPSSSGRTSVLLATLAAATKRGEICALIDAADSFDPNSAAAAGIDLSRLLWVRCTKPSALDCSVPAAIQPRMDSAKSGAARYDVSSSRKAKTSSSLLARPPRPSRQLRESRDGYVTASTYRGAPEPSGLRNLFQPASECADFSSSHVKTSRPTAQPNKLSAAQGWQSDTSRESPFPQEDARTRAKRLRMEDPVEQALRATDLLLQSGGFGLVAIDLAGVPVKTTRRVPLTTWFRFRRVIEGTSTIMLLIGEQPCAQTCTSLGLKLAGQEPFVVSQKASAGKSAFATRSSRAKAQSPAHTCLFEGLHLQVEILRARTARKPMQSVARFPSKAAWTG